MSLKYLVTAARMAAETSKQARQTESREIDKPVSAPEQPSQGPEPGRSMAPEPKPIIEAEETSVERPRSKTTSINAIAKELQARNKMALSRPEPEGLSWEQCKSRKKTLDRYTCLKFMSYCSREKCPKQYIDF